MILLYNFLTKRSSSVLEHDASGSASIVSLSYYTMNMMYFSPLMDVTGNRPVLSE